jgi:hypothetical protein
MAMIVALGLAGTLLAQNPQSRGLSQAQAAAAAAKGGGTAKTGGGAPAAPAAKTTGPAAQPGTSAAKGGAAAKPGEKRDPFRPTIDPTKQAGQIALECPPGVRGIIVGQAELNGVARSPNGIIAVVTTTNTGRTYFLREGNTLCNGRVLKITADSIVFEENVVDPAGRVGRREVIKKIPGDAM